ncbi:hypothetical protein [uncultured Friedmanniella sp.]|uniref:hypothetical protein n=1 Tax=uncultured Friedmanniella sp. TaxID=335381 RepID=UPI0035C96284
MDGPLRHSVSGDGLAVDVVYTPHLGKDGWTADGTKPVQVSVTAKNRRRPGQKIFVTRATMRFTVSDISEELVPPDPLVDAANITPGYLATSPYSYNQSFAIPQLDSGARVLAVDVKVELVSLVDAKAKDYSKQTVTDSFSVSVTS